MYLVLGYSSTGGALLRWFRDTFASAERQQAAQTGEDVYDLILAQAEPGPSPVLILPHFVGSGTPWMDPRSRGAILGLDLRTTRGQIVRAIVESVTYETKLSVDAMEAAGIAVRELRACGGGARSALWLQTKADIFQRPVAAMDVSEAPCLGVALLAGVALGTFPNLQAAVAAMVRVKHVYHPDPARSQQYAARAGTFAKIYPVLAELNHEL
jgi:xylulokinase